MVMGQTCDPGLPNEPESSIELQCPHCGSVDFDEKEDEFGSCYYFCYDCGSEFNWARVVELEGEHPF